MDIEIKDEDVEHNIYLVKGAIIQILGHTLDETIQHHLEKQLGDEAERLKRPGWLQQSWSIDFCNHASDRITRHLHIYLDGLARSHHPQAIRWMRYESEKLHQQLAGVVQPSLWSPEGVGPPPRRET